MEGWRVRLAGPLLALACLPAGSVAQTWVQRPLPAALWPAAPLLDGRTAAAATTAPARAAVPPHRVFVASAVLPGGGQWLLGSKRWIAYGAVETGGWLLFLNRRGRGRELETAYRDLAWSVARAGTGGGRREGDFEYYETMAHYAASGAFDTDPGRAGVQPEPDEATYNGMIWSLARGLHLPAGADTLSAESPEYAAALAYYESHAVPEDMLWDWQGNESARNTYVRLIDRSDAALRTATQALGLLLANHVISAVDALITARLRGMADAVPDVELRTRLDPARDALRWSAAVHLTMPRRR